MSRLKNSKIRWHRERVDAGYDHTRIKCQLNHGTIGCFFCIFGRRVYFFPYWGERVFFCIAGRTGSLSFFGTFGEEGYICFAWQGEVYLMALCFRRGGWISFALQRGGRRSANIQSCRFLNSYELNFQFWKPHIFTLIRDIQLYNKCCSSSKIGY